MVPPEELGGAFPRSIVQAPDGTLWIATNEALYRREGEWLERIDPAGELTLAELAPRELLLDSRGTLWVGTRRSGLAWSTDPAAPRPVFRRLGSGAGLPSDYVLALAEDELGRIWIGTGRGLVRFDPADESLRRFSTADGLAGEIVNDLLTAPDGTLWAAVAGGLSHVDPRAEAELAPPPPVFVRRVEVGGRRIHIPQSGVQRLSGLELAPSERTLVVAYTGIDLATGAQLGFQHRLEGLEGEWSVASSETSVSYGSLAPGAYRFLVRARTHDGVTSTAPAEIEFVLAAPFWRRAWFPPAVLVVFGVGAWFAQRARARRAQALERIRRQIATDLHDEVGSSLAQIAVLSEVARRAGPAEAGEHLQQVAELARATRGSLADLVWAIDPLRDTLQDLLQRLRMVTANLLAADGIELALAMPKEDELERLLLPPDKRRQLLYFFKEVVHNVARHSAATRVEIELALEPGRLRLAVRDDGRGFDPALPVTGQGLANLRRRAEALGGRLTLESRPGGGTRVELAVPL
jgi:signal transduction histidine kinase